MFYVYTIKSPSLARPLAYPVDNVNDDRAWIESGLLRQEASSPSNPCLFATEKKKKKYIKYYRGLKKRQRESDKQKTMPEEVEWCPREQDCISFFAVDLFCNNKQENH